MVPSVERRYIIVFLLVISDTGGVSAGGRSYPLFF